MAAFRSDTHRARTPEQKRDVLERIYEAWVATDDYRLGQLLTNATRRQLGPEASLEDEARAIFYIEDYDLVDCLKRE